MRFFSKLSLMVALLAVVGCNQAPQETKVRIVDLQGNPHNVQMRTPELNMQALADQGNLSEEKIKAQPRATDRNPPAQIAGNKYADQNFAGSASEALQNTLQMQTAPRQPYPANMQDGNIVESDLMQAGDEDKNDTIEYNLAGENKKPVAIAKTKEDAKIASKKQKGLFVQTGSFSVLQHAKISLTKVEKFSSKNSPAKIEEANSNGKIVYRVLIGPFSNKQKAKAMVTKLKKSGHQAIIIRNK